MAAESSTLQVVTTVIALVSAISAVVAAVAALRSAQAAQRANENVEKQNTAELFARASLTANSVLSASVRVDDLANDLKLEYDTLFAFANAVGSGRHQLLLKAVEDKKSTVGPIQTKARDFLDGLDNPSESSSADLVRVISEFEGDLSHLDRVKEKLIFDVSNVRADNRIYREKAIHT